MPTPWGFVVALLAFYFHRKIVNTTQDKEAKLTMREKAVMVVLLLIEPIWAGLIYYFGLKSIYPQKASQAAKYAIVIFVLGGILLFAILLFFFLTLAQGGF